MIVRTKEEYDKEQRRKEMIKEEHKCPCCGSINTRITCLVYIREVPKPGLLGMLMLSCKTVYTPVFECEKCHTRFTVDALDEEY